MKTLFVILIAAVAANSPVWAQQTADRYQEAMSAALGTLKTHNPKTAPVDLLAMASQFERIAGAEPTQWLPRYYAALQYVFLGFSGKDAAQKDTFLDQADANLKAAETLSPKNDELAILRAYIAQARMVVDPQSRWQQYGPLFQAGVDQAKALNPNNPRAYVLEGTSLMYTPAQFGGGPATACPLLKQAVEKFATFKPASDLHPGWGQKQIAPMLEKCK